MQTEHFQGPIKTIEVDVESIHRPTVCLSSVVLAGQQILNIAVTNGTTRRNQSKLFKHKLWVTF